MGKGGAFTGIKMFMFVGLSLTIRKVLKAGGVGYFSWPRDHILARFPPALNEGV